MILLIGPDRWCAEMKHLLSDRTTHKNRVATTEEHLRGVNEHIEIVRCTGSWEPSLRQIEAENTALYLNAARDRRAKLS